VRSPVRTW